MNPLFDDVHWHEGLFLRPHHLQMLQRSLGEKLGLERHLGWSYPYGLVERQLSVDALENRLVQFDRLRAVTPGGTVVCHPGNVELSPLDIRQAFESGRSFTVLLGVPRWYNDRANTLEGEQPDVRVKRLYRVSEAQRLDENTGDNAQPVLLRRLNARLLFEDDDQTDLDVMPLVRITQAVGEKMGSPREDPHFIPPCLLVSGSPILRDLLRDLANATEASRKELMIQLSRAGVKIDTLRGTQFEQLLRLRTLGRFGARLPSLVQAPGFRPFEAYLELREFLSELAALYPERDLFLQTPYDHDRPAVVFQELAARIRSLLRGAVEKTYWDVPFVREGKGLVANLEPKHVSQAIEYYLGIETGMDPRELAALVETAEKFRVVSRTFLGRPVFGIKVLQDRNPPTEFPARTGLYYFRLYRNESANMWSKIAEERSIGLHWQGSEAADFKVSLYMTVSQSTEAKK